MADEKINPELQRLQCNASKEIPLEKWGPYLSERQWGTVREDYSKNEDAWNYFPHDHARSRAYRWGEDGIAGISDIEQHLCFAIALWNGKDSILKERLFGLSNPEGNHGEDVKELYYYLDNVPTHYYMKYLYKYPQAAFPYDQLINENRKRDKTQPEYEILDTGVLKESKYFDVFVEYAKESSEDIFIKIEIINRGSDRAPITLLPTLWFFNNWFYVENPEKPSIELLDAQSLIAIDGKEKYFLYFQNADQVLFTENETNYEKLFNRPNASPHVKDAFHDAIIHGKDLEALAQKKSGTKSAAVYHFEIDPKGTQIVYLRLTNQKTSKPFFANFEQIFVQRKAEADTFYASVQSADISDELRIIQRQAFASLLWNKQYYHFDVETWINSSDGITPLSEERKNGRNKNWKYLKNQDVLSMPDKWEYPWYAAWDTAFHCITMAIIDPVFAKHQLILLMREWYMNPKGQLPAYEWDFGDVNPPVHAFAAFQVYQTEREIYGNEDIDFLKKIFQKLIINFTWWVNRKDADGNSIFEGGFLGLDNIGIFDRSKPLLDGMLLEQADGTSWMGMYALDMMNIAMEIAVKDPTFEDSVTKFYEHFVIIAEALNRLGLWDEQDKFYYDVLSINNSDPIILRIRSVVGLSPLFAVGVLEKEIFEKLNDFQKRMEWFQNYRRNMGLYLPSQVNKSNGSMLLSLVNKERLQHLCDKLLDEDEFLSFGGIRALSKYYEAHPFHLHLNDQDLTIQYDPGDSTSGLFGGNSNWRGPVWFPINFLLINAFVTFGYFYGDSLQVEFPKGSGEMKNLSEVGEALTKRLFKIFEKNEQGERPVFGPYNWFYQQPENKDLILFHEYFHGDTLRGMGASHQAGWTALVANLITQQS